MSSAQVLLLIAAARQSSKIQSVDLRAKRNVPFRLLWIEDRPRSNLRARDSRLSSSFWPKRAHAWRYRSALTRFDGQISLFQPCRLYYTIVHHVAPLGCVVPST